MIEISSASILLVMIDFVYVHFEQQPGTFVMVKLSIKSGARCTCYIDDARSGASGQYRRCQQFRREETPEMVKGWAVDPPRASDYRPFVTPQQKSSINMN